MNIIILSNNDFIENTKRVLIRGHRLEHIRNVNKPSIGDELPDMIKDTIPFVAHPYTSEQCPYNIGKPVTLAVGPEGGFIPYEVNKLIECGFTAVHIGERILHVESAISGLISRLM